MEVRLADCAGFCFGVKRAVDTVYEQLKNGKTIYTYGPIVHNEEVVRELSEKGVRVLENKEDLKQLKAGENIPTVIIRAHGVAKEIYDIMEANGLECIDATCPFVKKIHRIVELKSNEGYHVIVVGDPKHPEVEGIVGWCPGPVTVLETPDQAENFVKLGIPGEFIGRNSCIVRTNDLSVEDLKLIITSSSLSALLLKKKFYELNNVSLTYDDDFITFLAEEAYKSGIGARGIKQALENVIKDLEFEILSGDIKEIKLTRNGVIKKYNNDKKLVRKQELNI